VSACLCLSVCPYVSFFPQLLKSYRCFLAFACCVVSVYVDVPNIQAREEILTTQARKLKFADDVSLRRVAQDPRCGPPCVCVCVCVCVLCGVYEC
jgi:hypothetical protein